MSIRYIYKSIIHFGSNILSHLSFLLREGWGGGRCSLGRLHQLPYCISYLIPYFKLHSVKSIKQYYLLFRVYYLHTPLKTALHIYTPPFRLCARSSSCVCSKKIPHRGILSSTLSLECARGQNLQLCFHLLFTKSFMAATSKLKLAKWKLSLVFQATTMSKTLTSMFL